MFVGCEIEMAGLSNRGLWLEKSGERECRKQAERAKPSSQAATRETGVEQA